MRKRDARWRASRWAVRDLVREVGGEVGVVEVVGNDDDDDDDDDDVKDNGSMSMFFLLSCIGMSW